jgi:hypothetical protein
MAPKLGDRPLCPRGTEYCGVFAKNNGALGQSSLSPIFAGVFAFEKHSLWTR